MRPDSRGFTLIEILMVMLVIALLAAIGIPRFSASRERALIATMQSDLRNLATAQEAYEEEFDVFYAGVIPGGGFAYEPSTAVNVALTAVSAGGWQAIATHTQTTRWCALYYGNAAPLPPASAEGVPACN